MDEGNWVLFHATGKWDVNYEIHYAAGGKSIEGPHCDHGKSKLLPNSHGAVGQGHSHPHHPGGVDFVGSSYKEMFFFGNPHDEKKDPKARKMYYGILEYGNNGKASLDITERNTTTPEA